MDLCTAPHFRITLPNGTKREHHARRKHRISNPFSWIIFAVTKHLFSSRRRNGFRLGAKLSFVLTKRLYHKKKKCQKKTNFEAFFCQSRKPPKRGLPNNPKRQVHQIGKPVFCVWNPNVKNALRKAVLDIKKALKNVVFNAFYFFVFQTSPKCITTD